MVMMKTMKAVMNDYQHQKTRPLSTQTQCTRFPSRLHNHPTAGKAVHHTEAEKERKIYRVRQRMSDYVRRLLQGCAKKIERRVLKNHAGKVLTISSCQERWNSKDGSHTTNNVVTRGHGERGVEVHRGLATTWYLIKIKSMLIGIKLGLNKEHGQPKLWSVCGSAMKRICQRGSGCWTLSKQKSRRSLTSCADEKSPPDWG